ncbi:MAG: hypothetical protein A3H91_00425 [Gammaproteobacteria bacterium RIFCSPLOWO2_02_FULL_61_13]|nr:MAG: hypothetical protein A3H91_00425 [Gammaproteobacteria bacterium RIFCSPLOWO2_02_FULL_61_13]
MKREDIDWSVLRGALVGFVLSVVVGGALAGGGHAVMKSMQLEFTRNNALFQGISGKYLAVDEEEKQIKKYFPRFLDLYHGGIIGREERLNWIETLRDAGERLRIPSLNYEIRSQGAFAPSFPLNLGRYQLYSSEMSLSLQALHEGDLLRLLQLLDTRAAGLYSIHACRMNKSSQVIDVTSGDKGNILVQCEMNWFTVKLADGTEIKVET